MIGVFLKAVFLIVSGLVFRLIVVDFDDDDRCGDDKDDADDEDEDEDDEDEAIIILEISSMVSSDFFLIFSILLLQLATRDWFRVDDTIG